MSLDVDPLERRLDRTAPRCRDRRERHDLVPGPGQAPQRAADVVADARPRMGERRHVHHDPHATQIPREKATAATAPIEAKAGTNARRYGARTMKIGKSASRNRGRLVSGTTAAGDVRTMTSVASE